MKKKLVTVLIAVMTMGVLAGCGGDNDESSEPVSSLHTSPIITDPPEESSEPSAEESSEEVEEVVFEDGMRSGGERHTIGERTVVDGKMQSWLTGEWKDAEVAQRRSMAVMMPNNRRAGYKDSSPLLHQYGIGNASIIYEAPVEGRISRLMPLYEDYDDLEFIGPVRSSRDYYIFEAMSFDAIYVNWGLARPWVEALINTDYVDNISAAVAGIYNGYDNAFKRKDNLFSGAASEFTGILDVAGYKKGVDARGYEPEYRDTFEKAFEFADEGYLATYDDFPDATKIYPGGTQSNRGGYGSHNPCFEYNEADRLYYRTQWGQEHIDGSTGEQLTVTNVILKVCDGFERLPDDPSYDYLGFETAGSGKAYVFTNGKVIEATWEREAAIDPEGLGLLFSPHPTRYYDKNGNEIVLNQGKTWICCIWDDYEDYVEWK